MKRMKPIARRAVVLLPLVCLVMGMSGCATVPETGRKQLRLIPESQEMQLGLTSFEKLKKETPISKDAAANEMLQRVGRRIAAVASNQLPNAHWEFVLFESKEPNAFCLPGGKVGVYTGILEITRDEAGLATVVAHEIAHAVARHGAERLSEALVIEAGAQILGTTISGSDPRVQAAVATAYGLGTTLGRVLPHSREQELEADYIGLIYMARAGYDPEQAVVFWQRFADYNKQRGGNVAPTFLRTHPLDETRIRHLQSNLPKAKEEYLKSQQSKR